MAESAADPEAAIRRGMNRHLEDRARQLAEGSKHRGWKVAFTTPQSQAAAGVSRSVVGWLADATETPNGSEIHTAGWTRPTIEGELALHLGDDREIAAVGLAIEVVDVDRPLHQVEDVVAGGVFHRAYVLGTPSPERRGGDVTGLVVRAFLNGELIAQQRDPCAIIGPLPDIIARVATALAPHGLGLQPGDIILGGSAIGLHAVSAGDRVRIEADGLGAPELTFV